MIRRLQIRASRLAQIFAGRADISRPYQVHLTFEQASGPAGVDGREVVTSLSQPEIAALVDSLPKGGLTAADRATIVAAVEILRESRVR